jgi:hypothetical protein
MISTTVNNCGWVRGGNSIYDKRIRKGDHNSDHKPALSNAKMLDSLSLLII